MQGVDRAEFYYSNRFLYYVSLLSGFVFVSWGLYQLFCWTVMRYLSGVPVLYPILLVLYNIAAFLAAVTGPLLFAVKISHRRADAYFDTEKVELRFWLHSVVVPYADVKRIRWYWVQFGSSRSSTMKRHKNYRLKVKKRTGTTTIAASLLETNMAAKREEPISLEAVCKNLCRRTGIKAEG